MYEFSIYNLPLNVQDCTHIDSIVVSQFFILYKCVLVCPWAWHDKLVVTMHSPRVHHFNVITMRPTRQQAAKEFESSSSIMVLNVTCARKLTIVNEGLCLTIVHKAMHRRWLCTQVRNVERPIRGNSRLPRVISQLSLLCVPLQFRMSLPFLRSMIMHLHMCTWS